MEPKNKAAIVEEKDDELVLTDEEFVSTDEMEDSLNAEYEDVEIAALIAQEEEEQVGISEGDERLDELALLDKYGYQRKMPCHKGIFSLYLIIERQKKECIQ